MDDIIERVRKLLAMANDERGNEHEREQALRRAHSLLMKHGLTEGDVDERTRDANDPRGNHSSPGWSMAWASDVCITVAKLFMCEHYCGHKVNSTKVHQHFVGRRSNALTAMYMAEYLIHSILKEGRRQFGHNLAPGTRAFALGAARTLRERVAAIRGDSASEHATTEQALAVMENAEDAANKAYLQATGVALKLVTPRGGKVPSEAYGAGKRFGAGLGLDVQVAGMADLCLPGHR